MTEETNGQPKRHLENLGGEKLLEKLKKDGWNPQRCDAEFSYMPYEERKSDELVASEPFEQRMMLPPELLPMFPMTGISMNDDSMTTAGIKRGDVLIMVCNAHIEDGKLVFASVGMENVIRFYFRDDEGNKWLLSMNEGVEPICISDRDDVSIIARVLRFVSDAPSMSYSECNKLTKAAKRKVEKPKVVSRENAQKVIKQLGPNIKVMRDWFSFYRPLVQYRVVDDKDYNGFCKLVKDTLPDHKPQPKYDEVQRLDDGCFRKPVSEWTLWSSPIKRPTRFDEYEKLAITVIDMLEPLAVHEDLTKAHEKTF